ncbi:MAG: ABZJ_00895 family protein, partial [Acinetobacter sp.]
ITVLGMWAMLAIPLFLMTYWFYGPQAQRMANKMFN